MSEIRCLDERPKVRWLRPELVEVEGKNMVALSDPAQLHQGTLLLSPLAYQITRLLDGTRLRSEITDKVQDLFGAPLSLEQLGQLLDSLEQVSALDNPRTRGYLYSLEARPAAHAGSAYPEEPEALARFLDQLLDSSDSGPDFDSNAYLIPHIDLRRGQESYAFAWNHLRSQLKHFDRFVILGISHAYSQKPFVLTRLNFETPLGKVETDRKAVEQLASALSFDPFTDEFNHLGEHSIEFQLIFLQHLCSRPFTILPILCGSFQEFLESPAAPESQPENLDFFQSLRQLLGNCPSTCWLASVDLAHLGQRFGGPPLNLMALERLEALDRTTMEKAVAADAEGFLESLRVDQGGRNYCGTSAIYTLLKVLQPPAGQLLHYQQCNESQLTSTVTVASACYPRRPR